MARAWSIPDELLERTDLDMCEKVIIAILDRLGALEKPINPSHKFLAQKLGMSESGIRKTIKRLEIKGFVKKEGKKWKINMYSLTVPLGHLSPSFKDTDSPSFKDTDNIVTQSKAMQINTKGLKPFVKNHKLPNPQIDILINALKEKHGELDDSLKWARIFASNILRFKVAGDLERALKVIRCSPYNNFRMIYRNFYYLEKNLPQNYSFKTK